MQRNCTLDTLDWGTLKFEILASVEVKLPTCQSEDVKQLWKALRKHATRRRKRPKNIPNSIGTKTSNLFCTQPGKRGWHFGHKPEWISFKLFTMTKGPINSAVRKETKWWYQECEKSQDLFLHRLEWCSVGGWNKKHYFGWQSILLRHDDRKQDGDDGSCLLCNKRFLLGIHRRCTLDTL